jgi:hypothetical protein
MLLWTETLGVLTFMLALVLGLLPYRTDQTKNKLTRLGRSRSVVC